MEVVAEAVVNQPGSDGGSSGWDLFTSAVGLPAARRILDLGALTAVYQQGFVRRDVGVI
jgi:hypothetical protein